MSTQSNSSISSTESNQVEPLKLALVISGDALIHINHEKLLVDELMKVADECLVVVACRVSPKQKAEIVNMVRKAKLDQTLLAIGIYFSCFILFFFRLFAKF